MTDVYSLDQQHLFRHPLRDVPLSTRTARHRLEVQGKMNNKLNGRSRAVLDALREGRHALVRPRAPASARA